MIPGLSGVTALAASDNPIRVFLRQLGFDPARDHALVLGPRNLVVALHHPKIVRPARSPLQARLIDLHVLPQPADVALDPCHRRGGSRPLLLFGNQAPFGLFALLLEHLALPRQPGRLRVILRPGRARLNELAAYCILRREEAAGWRDPAGNGPWTWHSLRHVLCTTALFTWKLDATDVSAMAGHANVRTTLDMYIGTTAGVLDRARTATE